MRPVASPRREDELHQRRVVDRRVGVGQGAERGDAAGRRRRRRRRRWSRGARARARRYRPACRPGRARGRGRRRRRPSAPSGAAEAGAEVGDQAVADQQVAGARRGRWRGRAAGRRAKRQVTHCGEGPGASTSSTAMRHGDAHLHLFADHAALRVVGDGAVDLDAAVHRAGMHDDRIRLGARPASRGPGRRSGRYSRDGGHQAAGHPLLLQAQHHHHVGAGQARAHVVEDLDAQRPASAGIRVGGPTSADAGAHRGQQVDVGARHAAVQHVAADGDGQALQPALAAADGQRVEQRLGRVLVRAVAGVDDAAADTFCDSRAGAPDWAWRTTSRSQCMAFRVAAVSISVSPLFTLRGARPTC